MTGLIKRLTIRGFYDILESMGDKKDKINDKHSLLEKELESCISLVDRTIRLTGTIGEDIDFDFIDTALSNLERMSGKSITIKINSTGGSTYEALAIVGRIKSSPCLINIEGHGAIMSAATLILACGHKRKMSKYSTFMWHEGRYGVRGTHSEISREVAQAEREEDLWAHWMAEFTIMDKEFWRDIARDNNYYANAEECLSMGIIDKII